jgi:hypothetical protein
MSLDVYGHLWPGDEDRIRGAISLDFDCGAPEDSSAMSQWLCDG